MNITVKTLPDLPGAHEIGWVDEALQKIMVEPEPHGALIARPVTPGDGVMVAMGSRLDGGKPFHLVRRQIGTSLGPARYAQFVWFDQRDEEWSEAFDRSGDERLLPAVQQVPGWVETLVCRSDAGETLVITLGESIEALQDCSTAIMRTEVLPWERPEHLAGPDRVQILQLMHVELPS